MDDVAIRVENLSKQYRIGGPQARYKTIRESLTEAVGAPFRRLSSVIRGQSSAVSNETIWALKDVSFEVKRGEVVGIIGRNGAGKTTLLKVLSRITEPTEGYTEIHGRVGSLLEVGTGFHCLAWSRASAGHCWGQSRRQVLLSSFRHWWPWGCWSAVRSISGGWKRLLPMWCSTNCELQIAKFERRSETMQDQEMLEVQQGIWIDERRIRDAGLGTRLQVVVRPGEIRILPVPAEHVSWTDSTGAERQESPKGWEVFRSLGRDAQPGRLPNAAVEHDRYLYGKGQ